MVPAPWHASDRTRPARRRWQLAFYVLLTVVYGVFVVSTIPGVRREPGYNLLLDGFLNNLAYMLSAVLCLIRARDARMYRPAWFVLGVGLALYGLRQHLLDDLHPDRWTRSRSRPSRTPCGCRSTRSRSPRCC